VVPVKVVLNGQVGNGASNRCMWRDRMCLYIGIYHMCVSVPSWELSVSTRAYTHIYTQSYLPCCRLTALCCCNHSGLSVCVYLCGCFCFFRASSSSRLRYISPPICSPTLPFSLSLSLLSLLIHSTLNSKQICIYFCFCLLCLLRDCRYFK